MKIVIAPDSFKESLNAADVAAALAEGLRAVLPAAEIVMVAMADGGEGTLAALCGEQGEVVKVHGPRGSLVAARYGVLADGCTAVIEVAQAIGLDKLPPAQRDPCLASSFGVGELITAALDRGLRGGGLLGDIFSVDFSSLDRRLAAAHFDIACDVDNPLWGERGAAAVFGPQKGATVDDVATLDAGLRQVYPLLESACGRQVAELAGAGAAGGLGAAMLLLGAALRPGVDIVIEATGLAAQLSGATLVITGEGRLDQQTLAGKAPAGVARLARAQGVPVVAVGGSVDAAQALWRAGLFDAVEAAVCRPCSIAEALRDAHANLVDAGLRIGMWLAFSRLVQKEL
jgi:glycerate 2-kinase